jgi:hypothetical protein
MQIWFSLNDAPLLLKSCASWSYATSAGISGGRWGSHSDVAILLVPWGPYAIEGDPELASWIASPAVVQGDYVLSSYALTVRTFLCDTKTKTLALRGEIVFARTTYIPQSSSAESSWFGISKLCTNNSANLERHTVIHADHVC